MNQQDEHQPVLLQEVLNYLDIKPEGNYIDATYGRGGHAGAILHELNSRGFLLAIDKDPSAVAFARQQINAENFIIKQGSFNQLAEFVDELDLKNKINGILLDLGVSSPQLDLPARGFSFLRDGPLDMRMNPEQGESAAAFIDHADEKQIAWVLKEYGEERFAKRIAKAIVHARSSEAITRTKQLASIIADAHPAWEKHKHPATRSFQAIRIYINDELQELTACLEQAYDALANGGRLAVISFHSLEDRIVKKFIQEKQQGNFFPRGLPVTHDKLVSKMKRIAWGVRANP